MTGLTTTIMADTITVVGTLMGITITKGIDIMEATTITADTDTIMENATEL